MYHHRYTDEEFNKIFLFTDTNEDTNHDASRNDADDVNAFEDVDAADIDLNDSEVRSSVTTNENRENERPTFTRTYDKNASDVDDVGKDDGTIAI